MVPLWNVWSVWRQPARFEDDFRVGLETCQEICHVFGHWPNSERSLATLEFFKRRSIFWLNDLSTEVSQLDHTIHLESIRVLKYVFSKSVLEVRRSSQGMMSLATIHFGLLACGARSTCMLSGPLHRKCFPRCHPSAAGLDPNWSWRMFK